MTLIRAFLALRRHGLPTPLTPASRVDVLVVGPGAHFLSGISQYTACLAGALTDAPERLSVAALLLRRLCPKVIYPGRERVGADLGILPYPQNVAVYDGLDYYWGPSLFGALRFLRRTRPKVVILQWWTATVAHSYLLIAWLARRHGSRLVVEFHEVLDVSEAALPLLHRYAHLAVRRLLRGAGAVVHSQHDAEAVSDSYGLADEPVAVVSHGPYRHLVGDQHGELVAPATAQNHPNQPVRLLFFGVIRPYKGLEELVTAFHSLIAAGLNLHLTVVGEVWQGYRAPLDMLASGPASDRVRLVEGYVPDKDVRRYFSDADLVVLPYRRSSASGPLHIAMSHGLPVVTTAVGGLTEVAQHYSGAVLVSPGDPVAVAAGIREALALVGHRHEDPASWRHTTDRFVALFGELGVPLDARAQPQSSTDPSPSMAAA